MLRRLALLAGIAAACGPPSHPGAAPPTAGPAPMPPPPPSASIHLTPGTVRYVVQYRRRVEQEIAGQQPTVMSYRAFITAAIASDGIGADQRVTHVVDSIVADSATFVPPTVNFAVAQGLQLTGRLAPSGTVRDVSVSDTAQARFVGQFLGNLRDFYPRIPPGGLRPRETWTDTTTTTERSGDSEVVRRAVVDRSTSGWEQRDGRTSVRVDVSSNYTILGTGEQGGQPFELVGSGTREALEFVSADGRYLGGEARDSAQLSITLPAQGMTVPIRQTLHATITVLP